MTMQENETSRGSERDFQMRKEIQHIAAGDEPRERRKTNLGKANKPSAEFHCTENLLAALATAKPPIVVLPEWSRLCNGLMHRGQKRKQGSTGKKHIEIFLAEIFNFSFLLNISAYITANTIILINAFCAFGSIEY